MFQFKGFQVKVEAKVHLTLLPHMAKLWHISIPYPPFGTTEPQEMETSIGDKVNLGPKLT